MSAEEDLRRLEEERKEREKAYIEFKGMIKGIRLGKLNPIEKDILTLVEWMINGFKNFSDHITTAYEIQVRTTQRIESVETKIEELENNILQLRQTLDRMVQDR